uniref:Uncharacterized protein n=1 Tax=Ananas comosus var. bracteatus TaxID=296719 RepID=A0A6V7PYU2_ANACO|nr:unnamed protein product [Ananas comosus var. bracteatus]
MPIPLAAQWYERNPFGFMFYAMARPSLRERILYFKQLFAPRCTTGPSIDHKAYSTLTEFILLKRNVKSSFSSCISLVWKECCLSVLLTTPRGQGRGRTVIPGFAVRYISIMRRREASSCFGCNHAVISSNLAYKKVGFVQIDVSRGRLVLLEVCLSRLLVPLSVFSIQCPHCVRKSSSSISLRNAIK